MDKVLFDNQEYREALAQLDQLMRQAENISDVDHKVLLYNVLQYFDSIHREPLARIMHAISNHPELYDKLREDETVQKLCELYDLESTPATSEHTMAFIPAGRCRRFDSN